MPRPRACYTRAVLGYALVLGSALLHASWNALAKRSRDPAAAVNAIVAIAGVLTAAVALGEWALGGRGASPRALGLAAITGLLEAGYFYALGRALTLGPLGPVYTISRGGAALLVWPISMLALGERVTPVGAFGSALVIIGLAASSTHAAIPRAAALYAATCALFITGYHFTYKYALITGTSPILVFAVSMVVATGVGAFLGGVRYRAGFATTLRAAPIATLIAGVICGVGFLLFMYALARGGAAYVFTLRNTSVVFAVALGIALGERPSRRALLGAALVFAGAIALGLSH